ncbi:MAG: hypothetical protein M1836_004737 [Candelina mexicana]|nr:MAG: hypothetical protein M1836_004737 [Candelina mexicana]
MFRFTALLPTNARSQHKSLDVITLFHKPSSSASIRALTLLKEASATASETATIDQAGDHTAQNKAQRSEFELNVTEDPPTNDQLRSILEYVGARKAGDIVRGARDEPDAMKKLAESAENFKRPVVSMRKMQLKLCFADRRSTDR